MRLALLALALAFPALSQAAPPPMKAGKVAYSGYDDFLFIGWNDSCSVALQYFSYPPLGTGLRGIPDNWRIGTLSIEPGNVTVAVLWADKGMTSNAWDKGRAIEATENLIRAGHVSSGHVEKIRTAHVANRPGLSAIIHSTATFDLGYILKWPPTRFKLDTIHYSPLSNCAFLIFRNKRKPRDTYRYRLVRMLNPGVRRKRARAHVTNGLFLYKEEADIYGAEEELGIAAEMDSDYPLALYYHAALLSTHGNFENSLERLKAAIKLKPEYAKKARKAPEFESLWRDRRFIAIAGKRGFFP